ncbi:MAG: hypothetical protein ACR5KV_00145 [Wolbachia sp.]
MKLGGNLIGRQNLIAKFFGYLLFTPGVAVKNLMNIGTTILKAPILLFVANEKKYGNTYFTIWKHQLKECWEKIKGDFSIVNSGERLKQKSHKPLSIVGTWNELNARRPSIEKDLEKVLSEENIKLDAGENLKKNLQNKVITGLESHKSSETYVEKEQNRRNSQQVQGHTSPFK